MTDIPEKAKKLYNEAVRILSEDLSQQRVLRGTDIVIENLKEAIEEYDPFFEAWRLLGEIYLGTEEPLDGYRALKRAYDLNVGDVNVATLLGEASLVLDRPHLALEYLEVAHKAEKVPLGARKLIAMTLAQAEKWQEAVRAFGEALAKDPSDGDIRRKCAELLARLGKPAEAVSVLADYLDPYRDFIDKQPLLIKSGWILQPGAVLNRLAEGAGNRALEKETVARPEDYRAWYVMGNVFLDGEKYEAAVVCYKRALRVHPDYYDALHNMGLALVEMGRTEDAHQMYESAVETDPDSPEAYMSIAELMEEVSPEDVDEIALNYLMFYRIAPETEGFEELETELRQRLEATPDIAQILLLGQVYLLRDEVEKAEQVLRLIEPAGSGEAMFQWIRGRVHHEQERLAEAEKAYRSGLEIVDPDGAEPTMEEDNPEAKLRFDLASLLEETGKVSEASEILEDGYDILNADGLSLFAELMVGRSPERAMQAWEKALTLDNDNPDALMGLANRLIETDRIGEGIVLYEQALDADPESEDIVEKLRELYPRIGVPELSPP